MKILGRDETEASKHKHYVLKQRKLSLNKDKQLQEIYNCNEKNGAFEISFKSYINWFIVNSICVGLHSKTIDSSIGSLTQEEWRLSFCVWYQVLE